FAARIEKPDDELMTMLAAVGSQIGQFIERRRAEQRQQQMQGLLVQSEKLASIGLLSAGVAHEINNPLAFVSNNLVVLQRDCLGLLGLVSHFGAEKDTVAKRLPEIWSRWQAKAEEIDVEYMKENLGRLLARTRDGVERVNRI